MAPLQPPWQPAYRRRAPPPPPAFQHIFDSWATSSIPVVDLDEEEEGIVLQQPRPPQRTNYMPNRRPLLSNHEGTPPTTAAPWPTPKKPANVWRNNIVKPGPPDLQEGKPKRYFSVEPTRKSTNWDAVPSTVADTPSGLEPPVLRPLRYESYKSFSVQNGCSRAVASTAVVAETTRNSDTEDELEDAQRLAFFHPSSPAPVINHSEAEMATDSPVEDDDKDENMMDGGSTVVEEDLPTSAAMSEETKTPEQPQTNESPAAPSPVAAAGGEGSDNAPPSTLSSPEAQPSEGSNPGAMASAAPDARLKDKAVVMVKHSLKKRKRKTKVKASPKGNGQQLGKQASTVFVDVFDENELLSCGLLLRSSVSCRQLRTQIQELAHTYWKHRTNELRLRSELGELVGETFPQDAPGQAEFDAAVATIADSLEVPASKEARPVKNESETNTTSTASAQKATGKQLFQAARAKKHKEFRDSKRISAARKRLSAGARKSASL